MEKCISENIYLYEKWLYNTGNENLQVVLYAHMHMCDLILTVTQIKKTDAERLWMIQFLLLFFCFQQYFYSKHLVTFFNLEKISVMDAILKNSPLGFF